MNYLSVKNWEEFQHYKDRDPPWIKLHRRILDDYDFSCLHDASKAHLILIWVLASQVNNKIPNDEKWIRNKTGVRDKIDINTLIDKGFLICKRDDSKSIAECSLKTEAETDKKTKAKKNLEEEFEEEFWPIAVNKKARGSARKAYLAARNKISKEELLRAWTVHNAAWKEKKGTEDWEFVPHPATWLNQERWDDDETCEETVEIDKSKWASWMHELRLPDAEIQAWFADSKLNGKNLVVSNKFKADYIRQHYMKILEELGNYDITCN